MRNILLVAVLITFSCQNSTKNIQNQSQICEKLNENQKFAFGQLGNLAPPEERDESASHHV